MASLLGQLDHIASMGPAAYAALAVVLLAEAVGIPSPDEATLFLAGVAVGRGDLSWAASVLASAAGAWVGALASYTLARRLGRPLVVHYGRRVGLTETRLEAADRFMRRYGLLAVFLGRVLSGVRLVVGYASGLFGMEAGPFAAASAAGALAWSAADVTAGMLVGHRLAALGRFARAHALLAALAAAVLVLAYLALHRRGRRTARPSGRS